MKLGSVALGRDEFAYGLALCLDDVRSHKHYRITPKTAKLVDWLFFSCFWWEHLYLLADFMRRAKLNRTQTQRPKIVVGGMATVNPVPFKAYADYVVVGDGEDVLPRLLKDDVAGNIYTDRTDRVKYGVAANLRPFCLDNGKIARVEIARGCRFRCRFCAVAHHKPYRELALDDLKTLLKTTRTKRVSLFAPEPSLHSQHDAINELCARQGKTRTDTDARLDRLEHARGTPRFGLEGLSERLRRSVAKPYTNGQVIDAFRKALIRGCREVWAYLILDLPGENETDWAEFRDLLAQIGELPGASDLAFKPVANVFLPTPGTPMANDGIHYDRDYRQQWADFFGRGQKKQAWKLKMVENQRIFGPGMRLLSMLAMRAGQEFADIETEATRKGAIAITAGRTDYRASPKRLVVKSLDKLLQVLDHYGGVDRYCEPRTDASWQCVDFPN